MTLRDQTQEQSFTRGTWAVPGLLLLAGMLGLLYLYLNVPPGFPEQWAGRLRLPDQSVRVSRLYREGLGLPLIGLPVGLYRLLHGALLVGLWPAYALAVRRFSGHHAGRSFWVVTAALLLTALAMPPLLSTDVFYYAVTGQIAAEYGANPHVLPPNHFQGSQLLPYNFWIDFPSPYGPVWTSVSAGVIALAGDSPLAASLAFKLLGVSFTGASIVLIHNIAQKLAPERTAQATALWAWNPLILLEGAGNGHNDALLALLLLGALRLLLAGKSITAYVLTVASALVKLTTLPVLALVAVGRLNRGTPYVRVRRAVLLGLLLLILSATVYAPYWSGPQTLQGLVGQPLGSVQGVVAGVAWSVGLVVGSPQVSEEAVRPASLLALGAVGAWALAAMLKVWRTGERLEPRGEGLLWGAMLVLVPVVFVRAYPWYTVPGLALLAAVWPHGRRTSVVLYVVGAVWFLGQYGF